MLLALTRPVPPAIVRCELTHLVREPIDVARAQAEHAAYEAALAELGCEVRRLAAEPELPDSVFVEDAAVVVDECAVIARPGAVSRRAEVRSVADALGEYRRLVSIEAPGTLDGGDVLRVGRRIFVGISSRTNDAGAAQLAASLGPLGYSVARVAVRGRLHLKSAASALGDDLVLIDSRSVDSAAFGGLACVGVPLGEEIAANVLTIGDAVLCAAGAPRTRALLEARGWRVLVVESSELAKAEAGLTCCSVIFRA
ncbi:MAG: arginine deiminase-related protein [Gemmatimonadaceae bacterium]